jgi:hypothetical protein
MAAWLTVRTSKSATCELLRVAWRTIGSIITRVNRDVEANIDRLEGLGRIGIDETSYKRRYRYLIVVVDHDTGRLIWAGPGRSEAALNVFFDELGAERASLITHVSADMADWIAKADAAPGTKPKAATSQSHPVIEDAPPATPNRSPGHATPLWKNPGDLNRRQRQQLEWIAKTDRQLWRAYLLKEGLRYVFAVKGEEGKEALDRWLAWHVDHNSHHSSASPRESPNIAKRSTSTLTTAEPAIEVDRAEEIVLEAAEPDWESLDHDEKMRAISRALEYYKRLVEKRTADAAVRLDELQDRLAEFESTVDERFGGHHARDQTILGYELAGGSISLVGSVIVMLSTLG